MIKPDQRIRLQRIQRLRLAAAVIDVLRAERPELVALYVNHDICKQLNVLADQYEAKPLPPKESVLRSKVESRKPPRVAMAKRRPRVRIVCRECREGTCKVHTPPPQDFDHEHEAEMADRFGHDIPDGSD